MFHIKDISEQGDVLSPFLFSFALGYAIKSVWVNQEGLKLNGTDQSLVYVDDNILGGSAHTIKKNTDSLVVFTKENELEVNVNETKYMVMSQDKNAGRSHNIKNCDSLFGRMEDFKYLGKTLINKDSMYEETKSRLTSGNACYHSVQNLFLPVCYSKI